MAFGDDDIPPWLDELYDSLSDATKEFLEDNDDDDDEEPNLPEPETEEQEEEFDDIEESLEISEYENDPHNALDNQADEDWELVYHFDFGGDAVHYVAGVPVGPLWVVWNDDGSADVYVDRDYEGASV